MSVRKRNELRLEDVLFKFENYLDDISPILIIRVEEEEFEDAEKIKNDIEKKVIDVKNFIIKNELSLSSEADILLELNKIKFEYLYQWYDVFSIDEERRVIV